MTRLVFLAQAILLAAFCISTAWGDVPLAKDGKALGVIVTNGHDVLPPTFQGARDARHVVPPASALQAYLRQITGAELPLVASEEAAGDAPAIVLRLVDAVPGASDRETAREAYRITTHGNRVTVTASTLLGLHHGIYGLLEDHLGCRFYTFQRKGLGYGGSGYEVVPKRPTLTLPELDDLQEPALQNRGIIFWMGSYPWIAKNRGIGLTSGQTSGALAAGHNMYHLIPPKASKKGATEIAGLFADHPEFYPVNAAGVREPTWSMGICGTNEELPAFIAAGLARDIEQRLERSKGQVDWSFPFSAAQGDGFSGCLCGPCRDLVHREESESAPLILALNRAIDIVHQTYPEARVITFAYFATLDAPKTLKPHKSLMINIVSSDAGGNAAGDQMGLIVDNPANRDYARALREWPQIAPGRVTVWHWDSYRSEWPSMFYIDDNMRYFRDCGVVGVNPQFCGGPWVDLMAWVYLKLAWNPDLDGDALIRQYLEDNYGVEAGAAVWDYLKLAQSGYEDTLYLPSAVRWSGWTATTRTKMYPPALLAQMTAAMDRAQAAAEAAGDPVRLANLISARGQSLDVVNLYAAKSNGKPWGQVGYDDGQWFVTGADERVPPALDRGMQGIVMDGGGEHGVLRTLAQFAASNGGPVFNLRGASIHAAVCPDLSGRIVSATESATGKELLAQDGPASGYSDVFGRISVKIWIPSAENNDVARRGNDDWSRVWRDHVPAEPQRLSADVLLSPSHYGFYPQQYVRRTVSVGEGGLEVRRQFIQEKSQKTIRSPYRFNTQWRLAMPDSRRSKVAVSGGGIDQLLDLQYAVAGGIVTAKAGEKMKGADWMDERFDTVVAISGAEVTRLPIDGAATGDVAIRFDRGDGTVVVLRTPVSGWDAVEIKPIVDQGILEVTLVGSEVAMDGEPATIDLPIQTLSAQSAPVVAAPAAEVAPPPAVPVARLRRTGETTAVNEIDGAELIWIPAGAFTRGSTDYADESPQKQVHLDGYWIYKFPVTVGQYKAFCEATGTEYKPVWGQAMHAVSDGDEARYAVQMNWYESAAYAAWAGGALPSEAQWEKAARGTDARRYPWGDAWDPARCVSYEQTVGAFTPGFMPVGSRPTGASPYGVHDMAGNVWEWVGDWYGYDYYATAPDRNPTGPETGSHKVIRGGCSLFDERFSRTAARMIQPPQVRDWTPIGFRCVIPDQEP